MTRAAAILLWIDAVGFGVPCLVAIWSLVNGNGVPLIMGFPAYGGGPFESHGVHTTVPLVLLFLLVCVLEGTAGWLLWGNHRSGAILAIALLPFGAVFWWGFALPFPPIFAVVRSALIGLSWRGLV